MSLLDLFLISSQAGLGYYAVFRLTQQIDSKIAGLAGWMQAVDDRLEEIERKVSALNTRAALKSENSSTAEVEHRA